MTPNVNLNERTSFYASDDLLIQLPKDASNIINFAYTDYGGDFFDKVAIAFFSEKYPENIVKENTSYSGENAFIFGEVAKEFVGAYESYPLGFDGMEEFYFEKEREAQDEGIEFFLKDCVNADKYTISENVPEEFREYVEGHCSITTQGLDFSEDDLIKKGIETGLLTPVIED